MMEESDKRYRVAVPAVFPQDSAPVPGASLNLMKAFFLLRFKLTGTTKYILHGIYRVSGPCGDIDESIGGVGSANGVEIMSGTGRSWPGEVIPTQ